MALCRSVCVFKCVQLCRNFLSDFIAGIESPDFSLYPDKGFQSKWLRVYLEEVAGLKGEDPGNVQEADVEKLYIEVNKFAPVSM